MIRVSRTETVTTRTHVVTLDEREAVRLMGDLHVAAALAKADGNCLPALAALQSVLGLRNAHDNDRADVAL